MSHSAVSQAPPAPFSRPRLTRQARRQARLLVREVTGFSHTDKFIARQTGVAYHETDAYGNFGFDVPVLPPRDNGDGNGRRPLDERTIEACKHDAVELLTHARRSERADNRTGE